MKHPLSKLIMTTILILTLVSTNQGHAKLKIHMHHLSDISFSQRIKNTFSAINDGRYYDLRHTLRHLEEAGSPISSLLNYKNSDGLNFQEAADKAYEHALAEKKGECLVTAHERLKNTECEPTIQKALKTKELIEEAISNDFGLIEETTPERELAIKLSKLTAKLMRRADSL